MKILCPPTGFVKPRLHGQDYLNFPAFCFLIENETLGKKILFDCGGRKDWWNLAKVYEPLFYGMIPGVKIEKDVHDILAEGGVDARKIESVVWSHWHVGHR